MPKQKLDNANEATLGACSAAHAATNIENRSVVFPLLFVRFTTLAASFRAEAEASICTIGLFSGDNPKLFEEGKNHFLDTVDVFNAPHAIHARYSPSNRATDA